MSRLERTDWRGLGWGERHACCREVTTVEPKPVQAYVCGPWTQMKSVYFFRCVHLARCDDSKVTRYGKASIASRRLQNYFRAPQLLPEPTPGERTPLWKLNRAVVVRSMGNSNTAPAATTTFRGKTPAEQKSSLATECPRFFTVAKYEGRLVLHFRTGLTRPSAGRCLDSTHNLDSRALSPQLTQAKHRPPAPQPRSTLGSSKRVRASAPET